MIAAALNAMMDPFEWFARKMGRNTGTAPYSYKDPIDMVAALNNPATEASAVSRMHKMHYGAFYGKTTRTWRSGFAERELLSKGKGWGGLAFDRPMKGLSIGISHFKAGVAFAPLTGILESYTAPKGHKISGLIGGASSAVAFAAGDLIGTFLGGPIAGFALGMATERLGGMVGEGVQMFNDFSRNLRHVNMGGNYEDTRIAYTMRQRAAQELGSSVMNARSYLGKEALLMHQ